jgi:hypothetical protein
MNEKPQISFDGRIAHCEEVLDDLIAEKGVIVLKEPAVPSLPIDKSVCRVSANHTLSFGDGHFVWQGLRLRSGEPFEGTGAYPAMLAEIEKLPHIPHSRGNQKNEEKYRFVQEPVQRVHRQKDED